LVARSIDVVAERLGADRSLGNRRVWVYAVRMLTTLVLLCSAATDAGVAYSALPGVAPVSMDYVAFDESTNELWVPAGNSGRIDVIDGTSGVVRAIENVPTSKQGERVLGPSSASVGEGVVFVGNRADQSVCAFDAKARTKVGCVTVRSMPDGVVWVAPTKEVWVTAPRAKALIIIDAKDPKKLAVVKTLTFDGEPEGYAVDAVHQRFFTNLEDTDATLMIDLATRAVLATWKPGCGEKGPRGVAVDPQHGLTFVACTTGVKALDAKGAIVGSFETGAGVDNIDWVAATRHLFVASAAEARLSVIAVSEQGALTLARSATTSKGCRTVVAAKNERAWLPDSANGRVITIPTP
jgi:DNA-binding beta-propeller fold protein YncE